MPNILIMQGQQFELQKGNQSCPKKHEEWLDDELNDQYKH